MPAFWLFLFGGGLTATALMTPWVARLAQSWGATDEPDGFRKSHRSAIPRLGGLAVVGGMTFVLAGGVWLAPELSAQLAAGFPFQWPPAFAALLVILGMGLIDDRYGLRPMSKLIGQTSAAALLFWAGFRAEHLSLLGAHVDFGPLALPVTCFWLIGCMNVWNLIDGLDGLASGAGAIVALTLAAVAAVLGHFGAAVAAVCLAGALAGFLLHNFHPARIFLGETGSLLLGTALAILALSGPVAEDGSWLALTPALAMGLPIVDALLAIARRWVRHVPWFEADRGHLHHQLIGLGLNQRQASLILYGLTCLLCCSALLGVTLNSDGLALVSTATGALGLSLFFPRARSQRQRIARAIWHRLRHRALQRQVARIVWEAIQRLDHLQSTSEIVAAVGWLAKELHCEGYAVHYQHAGQDLICHDVPSCGIEATRHCQRKFEIGMLPHPPDQQVQQRYVLAGRSNERLVVEFRQRDNDELPLRLSAAFLCRFNRALLVRARQLVAGERRADRRQRQRTMLLDSVSAL